MRISKIATEFNIGIETIINFLVKKGLDPTTKLTPMSDLADEQVEIIKQEFYFDKSVKERSYLEHQKRLQLREKIHDESMFINGVNNGVIRSEQVDSNRTEFTLSNIMMKEIIKTCYQEIETVPGFYRDFHLLWESVNEQLREQGGEQITEETLSDIILKEYPGTKFQENYIYDNEEKNLHFSIPKVVRIVFPKEIRTLSDDEKSSLQVQISNIIMTSIGYSDGWYDMSEFSASLIKAGFSYKSLGFENLSSLLIATFDEYDKENRGIDDTHPHYYWFVDIKKYATEKLKIKQDKTPKNENKLNKKGKMSAFEKLMNFAVFLSFNEAISQLAEKSLKEHWFYGKKDSGKYPILKNYFQLTFERLLAEDAQNTNNEKWAPKILTNEKYAVFNTGLVDHLYEPIYALFKKNKSGSNNAPRWFFSSFVGSKDIDRQTLTREFGANLPMPAHYYNSTSELVTTQYPHSNIRRSENDAESCHVEITPFLSN